MLVPLTLRPTSAAVKFAVAEVIVVEAAVVATSVRDRPIVLSILNDVPAAIAAVVALLSVTRPAPLIDFTKVRGAMPAPATPTPVIGRFTKAPVAAKFVAVKVVAQVTLVLLAVLYVPLFLAR